MERSFFAHCSWHRDVNGFVFELFFLCFLFDLLDLFRQFLLHMRPDLVCFLSDRRPLFRGQASHAAQHAGELALLPQKRHSQFLELRKHRRSVNRLVEFLPDLVKAFPDSHTVFLL